MSEKNLREYDQFSFNCPTNNLKAIRINAQIAELPFFWSWPNRSTRSFISVRRRARDTVYTCYDPCWLGENISGDYLSSQVPGRPRLVAPSSGPPALASPGSKVLVSAVAGRWWSLTAPQPPSGLRPGLAAMAEAEIDELSLKLAFDTRNAFLISHSTT